MIVLFFLADKIKVNEARDVFYLAGLELLFLDAPLAGWWFGVGARMLQP
jgi:hypothetical protein